MIKLEESETGIRDTLLSLDDRIRYEFAIRLAEELYDGKYVPEVIGVLDEIDKRNGLPMEMRLRAFKAGENYVAWGNGE